MTFLAALDLVPRVEVRGVETGITLAAVFTAARVDVATGVTLSDANGVATGVALADVGAQGVRAPVALGLLVPVVAPAHVAEVGSPPLIDFALIGRQLSDVVHQFQLGAELVPVADVLARHALYEGAPLHVDLAVALQEWREKCDRIHLESEKM